MTLVSKVVGLQIVHLSPQRDEAVALDEAISRPLVADAEFLYGLYGDRARREFLSAQYENLEQPPPRSEVTTLEVRVPHEREAKLAAAVGLRGIRYLGENALADFRKAFQALFCDVVLKKHGPSKQLAGVAAVNTKAGFEAAMLAFPDCIAEALKLTDIVVAVMPMLVKNGLTLPVTIVAKKAVAHLLWRIGTDLRPERSYYMTDARGRRQPLVQPELLRPTITISGRLGTVWKQGAHHPGPASAPLAPVAGTNQAVADADIDTRASTLVSTQEPIAVVLHMLPPVIEASTGSLVYPVPPQRLPLSFLFRLVRMDEGRKMCGLNAAIDFCFLPATLKRRHAMAVDRLYFINGRPNTRHLRFILEDGEEVRYDENSEPVDSSEPGVEVFNARSRRC